jgi:hypothetical protein
VALLAVIVARSILKTSWPLQARTLLMAAVAFGATAYAARHAWAWIPASIVLLVYCCVMWRDRNVQALRGAFANLDA